MKNLVFFTFFCLIIATMNLMAQYEQCTNQVLEGTNCSDYTCSSYWLPIGDPDQRGQPGWDIYYCYRYCDGVFQLQITQIDQKGYHMIDNAKALAWAMYMLINNNPDIFPPDYLEAYEYYQISFASCWHTLSTENVFYQGVLPNSDHSYDEGWIYFSEPCHGTDCCVQKFWIFRAYGEIWVDPYGEKTGIDNCQNATPANQCYPICEDVFTRFIYYAQYNGYPPETMLYNGLGKNITIKQFSIEKSNKDNFYCRITSSKESDLKISIFNLQGQRVSDKWIHCNINYSIQKLDLSTLQNGVYFIYVYEDNLLIKCEKILVVN